jgi:hypothetical protein
MIRPCAVRTMDNQSCNLRAAPDGFWQKTWKIALKLRLAVLALSVRPWARPLQAEFLKFGAKVHEGGDWQQPFEQVERVK